ncbi:DUF3969 family protein [Lactovum odontotermitis]
MLIKINDNKETQRAILIIIVGLMESLLQKVINIEDTERSLFTPSSLTILRADNLDERILDLIEKGTELEDIESLAPESLEESILEIKSEALELLAALGKRENYDYWLQSKRENPDNDKRKSSHFLYKSGEKSNRNSETKMKLSDEEAQKVLDDAIQSGKQKYGIKDGKIYEFQNDNSGNNPAWHGYEISGDELREKGGINVLRKWREEGKISNSQYGKLKKGK